MLKSDSAATDIDLISYMRSIPDAQMRRGVRIPAWYLRADSKSVPGSLAGPVSMG